MWVQLGWKSWNRGTMLGGRLLPRDKSSKWDTLYIMCGIFPFSFTKITVTGQTPSRFFWVRTHLTAASFLLLPNFGITHFKVTSLTNQQNLISYFFCLSCSWNVPCDPIYFGWAELHIISMPSFLKYILLLSYFFTHILLFSHLTCNKYVLTKLCYNRNWSISYTHVIKHEKNTNPN